MIMNNPYDFKKQMQEEQRKLKACKTKGDLNKLWKDRKILVKDGSEWDDEVCDFVEIVGEGSREKWKMKLKTKFGTFLELSAAQVVILTQQIKTTDKEAGKIMNEIKRQFPKQ